MEDLVSIELINFGGKVYHIFNSLKFKLPALCSGMYIIKLQHSNGMFVEKIFIN